MRRRLALVGIGVLIAGTLLFKTYAVRSPRRSTGVPRAVVEETICDLGVLDPTDECKHRFIVRNEGSSPLAVAKAGTTCKCTVSMLPSGEIPPGMGGPIEIELKRTEDKQEGFFRHSAAFLTNDPDSPRIELTIEGEFRTYLKASPPSIDLPTIEPGQVVETSTLIYSQTWEEFSFVNVESSLEGLTWHFQPAPDEKLDQFDARSGYVATFCLPAECVGSGFNAWVKAVAETTEGSSSERGAATRAPFSSREDQSHTRTIQIQLSGRVPPVRSVYGDKVDHEGVVTIGTLAKGKATKVRLLLKVRGHHREISVEKIDRDPEFLEVSVAPQTPELAKKGLYVITIAVPANAPICNFLCSDSMGEIRVLTDHPEMPEIVKLRVAFAVTAPRVM